MTVRLANGETFCWEVFIGIVILETTNYVDRRVLIS